MTNTIEKDWTGNKNSVFKTLGASNHTDKERQNEDYYATDTDHLLEVIDALAYQLACYKYPHHKVHNSDDKEKILTDVGLHDYFKRELVKER